MIDKHEGDLRRVMQVWWRKNLFPVTYYKREPSTLSDIESMVCWGCLFESQLFFTKQIGIFWNDKAKKDVTNVFRYCLHYTLKASDDVLCSETARFDWSRCYQSWSTIIQKILRKIIPKHISLPRRKTEIRKFYWPTNQNIHRNYRNK